MVTGSGGIDGCRAGRVASLAYSHSIVAGGFDEMS